MSNININPVTAAILIVFIYPILKGFVLKFSSNNLKIDIDELAGSVSFIAALFIGIYYGKKLFLQHDDGIYKHLYYSIPNNIIKYIENNTIIVYVILIPMMIFIVQKIILFIINIINSISIYLILDSIEMALREKSGAVKRIIGAIFQLPKSVAYVLFLVFALNIFSMFNVNIKFNNYLDDSKIYKDLCREIVIPVTNSNLAKKLPDIIDNSFKVIIKNSKTAQNSMDTGKTIVYYNGVTLEDGIKSNDDINRFAVKIGSEGESTIEKAQIIYNWIGSNISYDNNKASRVLNDDFNVRSGAIPTFQTRRGICFDYSCLYVAMCRANKIKVRLVTGQGFNGVSWVNHAWNQVYIPEKNQWINVDTTFYKGGNYFNSKRFYFDHKNDKVVGEW